MAETTYMIPKTMPQKVLKNIEKLKQMPDEAIDYSDIPPLNDLQLAEIANIAKARNKNQHQDILQCFA
ncbi:MAG: hypothetical protein Ta2A_05940 [Treponemataceae bacterium]|nr:MAG: hypothetical protein Ta2A_05940 [Treponemataceae bacterium]